jgi:hypothetical protein
VIEGGSVKMKRLLIWTLACVADNDQREVEGEYGHAEYVKLLDSLRLSTAQGVDPNERRDIS